MNEENETRFGDLTRLVAEWIKYEPDPDNLTPDERDWLRSTATFLWDSLDARFRASAPQSFFVSRLYAWFVWPHEADPSLEQKVKSLTFAANEVIADRRQLMGSDLDDVMARVAAGEVPSEEFELWVDEWSRHPDATSPDVKARIASLSGP